MKIWRDKIRDLLFYLFITRIGGKLGRERRKKMPVARPELSDSRVIAHVDMDCFYVQGLSNSLLSLSAFLCIQILFMAHLYWIKLSNLVFSTVFEIWTEKSLLIYLNIGRMLSSRIKRASFFISYFWLQMKKP